jgi:outer membrane receptor protein involved in Fe transport
VSGTWQPTTLRSGSLDGNQINAVPEGMAYGRVTWTPIANASLDAGVRWVGRQWLDKENDHPIGDFTTVELGGSMRYQHLRASVRVANLLDRRFVETGFIGVLGEERLWPGAGPRAVVALKFE